MDGNPYGGRAMGVEPPASAADKMSAAAIPRNVAILVGGSFLFLLFLRGAFKGAVIK